MFMGLICACAQGSAMPLMMVLFGNMTDMFIDSGSIVYLIDEWMPTWQKRCQNLTQGVTLAAEDPCSNVTTEYILSDPQPPNRIMYVFFSQTDTIC